MHNTSGFQAKVSQQIAKSQSVVEKAKSFHRSILRPFIDNPITRANEQADSIAYRYTGSSRRLTEQEEDEIAANLALPKDHPNKLTVQQLASKYAVSRPTIYNVRDRRHIPGHHHVPGNVIPA